MISYPFTSRVTYDAQSLPIYDRAVDSAFLRRFYKAYWDDGVFYKPSTSFAVTATGTGMNVQVHPGMAQVQGAFCLEDTVQTLPIAAADASLNRIDSVVLRLDLSLDKRDISLAVVSGVAAVSPVAPALTRNNTTWELGIANVLVSAGVGVITQRDVEDTRLDDTRCGAVAQTVGELDTSGFFAQLTAMIARLREEIGDVETGTAAMLRSVYDPGDDGVNICVQEYECSKSGSVYALTGEGAVGRFKVPAAWSAGDTWTVNGKAVPAYCGADAADGDCVAAGRWITFVYDGARLDFDGGGGLSASKLAQATAASDNVLAGKSFYAVDKTLKEGTMPNRGAWGAQLSPGGGTNVPKGYHDGSGQVTVQKAKVSAFAQLTDNGGEKALDRSYTVTDANALVIIMYGSNLNKINEPVVSSGTVSTLGTLGCQLYLDGKPYGNYAKGFMVNNIDGTCTLRLTTSSWDWGFGFIILKVN